MCVCVCVCTMEMSTILHAACFVQAASGQTQQQQGCRCYTRGVAHSKSCPGMCAAAHMRLGDTQVTAPAAVVLKCRYWPAAALISARGSSSWQVANSTWQGGVVCMWGG